MGRFRGENPEVTQDDLDDALDNDDGSAEHQSRINELLKELNDGDDPED